MGVSSLRVLSLSLLASALGAASAAADGPSRVLHGNTCSSGHAGMTVSLFIKDASGKYVDQLGFPGASADPKAEKSKGYPDLLIGGPGFCFPVYRWNGSAYEHLRNEPQEPGGCDQR